MPAPRFTICFSNYIGFGLNILGNPVTLLTLFVLKIDCSMCKVTLTVTSFKNIVAYCRTALNPVYVIVMCIGEEIYTENGLHRRSFLTVLA